MGNEADEGEEGVQTGLIKLFERLSRKGGRAPRLKKTDGRNPLPRMTREGATQRRSPRSGRW